mgnify:CR=1 FL=1
MEKHGPSARYFQKAEDGQCEVTENGSKEVARERCLPFLPQRGRHKQSMSGKSSTQGLI